MNNMIVGLFQTKLTHILDKKPLKIRSGIFDPKNSLIPIHEFFDSIEIYDSSTSVEMKCNCPEIHFFWIL